MYTGTRTLGAVLERNSLYHPDVEALIFEDRRLTHRQFRNRATRLASSIFNLGLKRQDRVSVLCSNTTEVLEIYFACYVAGYIATPVNFRLAVPEMQYILKDAAPKVLFFEAQYTEAADR